MTDLRLAGWKTDAGRREYLAAYDAALELWTAPYESVEIPSRFGPTRGIASGPTDGPVMLLLPAATGMGAIQWYPNAGPLAAEHRVIALDFVAGPGGGAQTRVMVDRHDYAAWLTDVLDEIGADRARFVGSSHRSRTPFDHLQNETQIASSGRQPIAARRRMASQSSGMRWARPYWMMASYCSLSDAA